MTARPDRDRRVEEDFDPERVVVRDKRRIDPLSGQLRTPPAGASAPPGAGTAPAADATATNSSEVTELQARLEERTADLQRVQAEFTNYRRRVDRDRLAVVEMATGGVLAALLPVLDDLDRARAHGDLTGAFGSVGEALEGVVTKLGLQRFGEPGEPFDPTVHEALMHSVSAEVSEPTCVEVLQPGYRFGDRVLRPARVAVADPGDEPATAGSAESPPDEPGPSDAVPQ